MSSQTTINVKSRIEFGDGFRFAWGVTIFVCVLLLSAQLMDDYVWPTKFDDSDAPPARSGLRIKTDNLTGCQYLTAPFGSITPRVDRDGKHICK